MLLIVSIIITAELYSTFKYHMKIGETTRCCSFFLRTHVKISSKISIIEFNIQIKWCIIVTPSREAEKDYQEYFNSPPHKKNHIATTMINTVLFKISTHILTKRMTALQDFRLTRRIFQLTSSRRGWQVLAICYGKPICISTHILTKRMTEYLLMFLFFCIFQLTSSRRGWRSTAYAGVNSTLFQLTSSRRGWHWTSSGSELDIPFQLTSSRRGWPFYITLSNTSNYFNSHPHEEDDCRKYPGSRLQNTFQLTSSRRGWQLLFMCP